MPLCKECCELGGEVGALVRWSSWMQFVPGGVVGARSYEEIVVVLS
jgi:hypothetical protein